MENLYFDLGESGSSIKETDGIESREEIAPRIHGGDTRRGSYIYIYIPRLARPRGESARGRKGGAARANKLVLYLKQLLGNSRFTHGRIERIHTRGIQGERNRERERAPQNRGESKAEKRAAARRLNG